MTPATLEAVTARGALGPTRDIRHFDPGAQLRFGNMTVETIPTAHDAADGLAFVVSAERKRLGILTDLGHVFDALGSVITSLDGVFIESNYDPEMLRDGPYPAFLN